ncbi:MAG: DUF3789 domain-containing protein [Candidatus Ornithomonoglobus sp.]
MVGIIISFAAGVLFGIVIMCCCVAAGREDRSIEKYLKEDETDIS